MPKISNAEFLKAISKPSEGLYKNHKESELWVCSKENGQKNWYGEAYKIDFSNIEDPNLNNYFCISRLKPIDGVLARKKVNFSCLMCVVLDDVGTKKAKKPELEPSWIIETSPGNEQWGYTLEKPITDEKKSSEIVNSLIAKGFCDEGATGPSTRYMRLPVGSNDKTEHLANNNGKPYPHKLKTWNPDLLYSAERLMDELGLNLKEEPKIPLKEDTLEAEDTGRETDFDLIQKIVKSESYHNPLLRLAARYISKGLPRDAVIQLLQAAINVNGDKSIRSQERYDSIPRLIDSAIEKFSTNKELLDRFKPISVSEFIEKSSIIWAIKHILPSGGLAMIYGASGTGKSFFALDIAGSIARGVSWCGKKVKQGKVIYIAAEGVSGFRNRLKAYCKKYNIKPDNFPFKIIPEAPDLTKDNDESIIASIKEDSGTEVVVIDTLAQVSAGANENSAEDMSMVLKRCQNIQKKTGALVLLIHHSGKDDTKGVRGWSGMRAAMDTVIKITSKKSHKIAEIDKQKDGEDNFKVYFHLRQLELGLDEDDEPITSCVVEMENSSFTPIEKPEPKGDIQKIVFEILQDSGETEKEDLISAVIKKRDILGKPRRRDSVVRAIDDMLKSSTLEVNQDLIRITQHHNTSKNNTCGDVAKSEILHNNHIDL